MNVFLCYCDESELWDVHCGLVSCYDDVLCVAGCLDIVALMGTENTKNKHISNSSKNKLFWYA